MPHSLCRRLLNVPAELISFHNPWCCNESVDNHQEIADLTLCRHLLDLPEEVLVKVLRIAAPAVRGTCRRQQPLWDDIRPTLKILVRLPHKTRLDCHQSQQLTSWLSRLTSLSDLTYHCDLIEPEAGLVYRASAVAPLAVCAQLTSLRLRARGKTSDVLDVDAVGACTLLRMLRLQARCLADISFLTTFVHLESLHLEFTVCCGHTYVMPLTACTALTALSLPDASQFFDIKEVTSLTSLRRLCITKCFYFQAFNTFSRLASLESFALEDAVLHDLGFLHACPSLRSLNLTNCRRLWDVSSLTSCKALTALRFERCWRVVDVAPLAACAALAHVTVCDCDADWDLRALKACCWMQVDDDAAVAEGAQRLATTQTAGLFDVDEGGVVDGSDGGCGDRHQRMGPIFDDD